MIFTVKTISVVLLLYVFSNPSNVGIDDVRLKNKLFNWDQNLCICIFSLQVIVVVNVNTNAT